MLLLAPDDVVFRDLRVPGRGHRAARRCRSPRTRSSALLVVTRLLTLLALLGALAVVVARHRRADGLRAHPAAVAAVGRDRLRAHGPGRWSWRRPARSPALVLAAAVVLTAVSVTDRRGPARTSPTSTRWWPARSPMPGWPAVVVGLDLPCWRLAGSLLGDRLDERDVTLLVLVLAVAVYGPLRTLARAPASAGCCSAGAATGTTWSRPSRPGSRRPARSTSSCRRSPAAVASTFKVPFVRVEVLAPDGGTARRPATARRPGEVQRDRHRLPRRARSAGWCCR